MSDEPTLPERIASNATAEATGRNQPFGQRAPVQVSEATLTLLGPEWREKLAGRSW